MATIIWQPLFGSQFGCFFYIFVVSELRYLTDYAFFYLKSMLAELKISCLSCTTKTIESRYSNVSHFLKEEQHRNHVNLLRVQ
jgi:hypothetical protein